MRRVLILVASLGCGGHSGDNYGANAHHAGGHDSSDALDGAAGRDLGSSDRCPVLDPGPVAFEDVTVTAGLPNASTDCLVFDDLDGDAVPDVLVGVPDQGVTLYRGSGDGTFNAEPLGVSAADTWSCASGDFDRDGVADLAVGHADGRVTMLRGLGDGLFEDVSDRLPAVAPAIDVILTYVGFVDFDADAWLDLVLGYFALTEDIPEGSTNTCGFVGDDYACRVEPPLAQEPPRLLRNEGGERFSTVADPFAGDIERGIWSVAAQDWDDDGWVDLYASVEQESNALYRNVDGSGAFEEILSSLADAPFNHAMGVAVADFDRDGTRDVYVTDLGPDQFWFGADGRLEDRAEELGIAGATRSTSTWSPVVADLNADGWLDLFVPATMAAPSAEAFHEAVLAGAVILPDYPQRDFLFVADGRGGFDASTIENGLTPAVIGPAAAAVADYDSDGDLDIAEAYGQPPRFRLLRNDTTPFGHWIELRVRGAASGVDAEGAVVEIERGGVVERREVRGETGGIGKSWRTLHFGLGCESIERITVRWPSGAREEMTGPIEVDRLLEVAEEAP